MNYLKALQSSLEMLRSNLEAIREADGFLYLIVKPSVVSDRDKFSHLHTALKLLFKDAVSIHVKAEGVGFKVDLAALRAATVRDYFNKDVSQQEIVDCVNWLVAHGWDEAKFQAETGISRATLYRYQQKTQQSQSETGVVQP